MTYDIYARSVLRRKQYLILMMTITLTSFTQVFAKPLSNKVTIPDHIDGATTINSESLLKLSRSMDKLVVIDSRITEDRSMGYIEDSLSLSDLDTNCESLKHNIPSLDNPTVFYCNGPKCGRSVKATKQAVKCNYSAVYWFKGGFEEWKSKDYPYISE